jgi:hypothetical protein
MKMTIYEIGEIEDEEIIIQHIKIKMYMLGIKIERLMKSLVVIERITKPLKNALKEN